MRTKSGIERSWQVAQIQGMWQSKDPLQAREKEQNNIQDKGEARKDPESRRGGADQGSVLSEFPRASQNDCSQDVAL